ncbi:MAG: acyl-CoA dehydratase activase [Promethearchaeota archaeon]
MKEVAHYAGIDSGSSYCKCVVVGDDGIEGKGIVPVEANVRESAKKSVSLALGEAGLKKPRQLEKIVVTGRNQKKVPFKGCVEYPSMTCAAKAVFELDPAVRTIVDVGGFTNKAIKLSPEGKVMEYVVNDKCASGSGFFTELVAKALETDVASLGALALKSDAPVQVTAQCSIFAESEVIYLVNEGKADVDIAAGVCNSIANRIFSLLKRVKMEREVALAGGVANNTGIRAGLEARLGFPVVGFDINPTFVPAYGAALIAKNYLRGK